MSFSYPDWTWQPLSVQGTGTYRQPQARRRAAALDDCLALVSLRRMLPAGSLCFLAWWVSLPYVLRLVCRDVLLLTYPVLGRFIGAPPGLGVPTIKRDCSACSLCVNIRHVKH